MENKYLEEKLKMTADNAKMWEEKWNNNPMVKTIIKETIIKENKRCSIF